MSLTTGLKRILTKKSEDFGSVSGNLSPKRLHASIMKRLYWDPPDDDDDDIMHDPDVREMVENGEHTCHMFDAPCQACEDDEDEEEDEMTQSAAISNVDKLRAHFC